MIDLELGPVVASTGGGVEMITEEVEVSRGESRTWELPDGWESGIIGARGVPEGSGVSASSVTVFASRSETTNDVASGFQSLDTPAVISTASRASWSGTVTLIRTA